VQEYEKTYTDGDGVVPSKVILDVVILELLHRFASARTRWPRSEENEERRRERTHKRLDVRQISMHVRRASTTSLASSSRYVACPSRSGSQLSSSFVSAVELPLVCSVPKNSLSIPLEGGGGNLGTRPKKKRTYLRDVQRNAEPLRARSAEEPRENRHVARLPFRPH
jgi:hypothetical protein